MGCCSIELSVTNLVLLGFLVFVGKKLLKFFQSWKTEKMLQKWNNSPKDKVILHTVWRGRNIPCTSPFGLKLETYLRMAKIPYEIDNKDLMGPKGKLPWITYNGQHMGDSHLIIQFLNKKLGINLNKNMTLEQQAVARACRVMLEEHWFWGVMFFRRIENASSLTDILKLPMVFKLFLSCTTHWVKDQLDMVGIGKHTRTEIYQMTDDDLHSVSAILGQKKFLGGDEPCEDDCAIFGMIAQTVWALSGSSYEKLANEENILFFIQKCQAFGELRNLKEYAERMKDRYWKDWNDCIDP